jgi:hypothetical protein
MYETSIINAIEGLRSGLRALRGLLTNLEGNQRALLERVSKLEQRQQYSAHDLIVRKGD